MKTKKVAITGFGLAFPGWQNGMDSFGPDSFGPDAGRIASGGFACEDILGKKGLRYKDQATRLALCAAKLALAETGLEAGAELGNGDGFGVVASSNFGNVDTVCRVAECIEAGHTRDVSPMDLPNASSNVIASNLAIRFGLRGVNLMLCNGSGSGTDAVWVAANCIRRGRADRMLVVGVEPKNIYVERALSDFSDRWLESDRAVPFREGAAALLLESEEAVQRRSAKVLAWVGAYAGGSASMAAFPFMGNTAGLEGLDAWIPPTRMYPPLNALLDAWELRMRESHHGLKVIAMEPEGETYGTTGVLQACLAASLLERKKYRKVAATSGLTWGDRPSSLIYSGAN